MINRHTTCYVFSWRRKNCRIGLARVFVEVPDWGCKLLPECRALIAISRRDWKFSNCREGVVNFFELGWSCFFLWDRQPVKTHCFQCCWFP